MSALTPYDATELNLSRESFPASAKQIVEQLQQAGFDAYIVGGGVRDLLLKKTPKDFDIATNALPEEIKHTFASRCRIIGRRFRLAHVRVGRHIIEVATFRGPHQQQDSTASTTDADSSNNSPQHHESRRTSPPFRSERGSGRYRKPDTLPAGVMSSAGMVLRDNVYGTLDEDAVRRDFTINALYYDPIQHQVLDFTQALTDIKTQTLRLIGDPEQRFREDPVRLLRAVRLSQKLNLTIAPETLKPLSQLAPLLHHVSAARLFDEVLKLFLSGHAVASFEGILHHNFLSTLFPATAKLIEQRPEVLTLLKLVMRNTDARLAVNKPVTPAFLFAAFLWYPVLERHQHILSNSKTAFFPALHQASEEILFEQSSITSIPKRFSRPMREIWELQFRLPRRTRQRAMKLLQHPRFRAGYDLLLLREEAKEIPEELGPWWTDFQIAEPKKQRHMLNALQNKKPAAAQQANPIVNTPPAASQRTDR